MSRRTQLKKSRAIHPIIGYHVIENEKGEQKEIPQFGAAIVGYAPPRENDVVDAEYRGYHMKVRVSPGQRINLRKEYKRQRKELGYDY